MKKIIVIGGVMRIPRLYNANDDKEVEAVMRIAKDRAVRENQRIYLNRWGTEGFIYHSKYCGDDYGFYREDGKFFAKTLDWY